MNELVWRVVLDPLVVLVVVGCPSVAKVWYLGPPELIETVKEIYCFTVFALWIWKAKSFNKAG